MVEGRGRQREDDPLVPLDMTALGGVLCEYYRFYRKWLKGRKQTHETQSSIKSINRDVRGQFREDYSKKSSHQRLFTRPDKQRQGQKTETVTTVPDKWIRRNGRPEERLLPGGFE